MLKLTRNPTRLLRTPCLSREWTYEVLLIEKGSRHPIHYWVASRSYSYCVQKLIEERLRVCLKKEDHILLLSGCVNRWMFYLLISIQPYFFLVVPWRRWCLSIQITDVYVCVAIEMCKVVPCNYRLLGPIFNHHIVRKIALLNYYL
jgi:hypothetical protein